MLCRREGSVGIYGAAEPRFMGGFGPPSGTYQPPSSLSLTRAWIIKHLRKECEEKYPNSVKFMDGYSLVGGNLEAGAPLHSDIAIITYLFLFLVGPIRLILGIKLDGYSLFGGNLDAGAAL